MSPPPHVTRDTQTGWPTGPGLHSEKVRQWMIRTWKPSIHLSINHHPAIYPSIHHHHHSPLHPLSIHPSIDPSFIHPLSFCLSIHHSFIHSPNWHTYKHPSIHLFSWQIFVECLLHVRELMELQRWESCTDGKSIVLHRSTHTHAHTFRPKHIHTDIHSQCTNATHRNKYRQVWTSIHVIKAYTQRHTDSDKYT